MHWKKIKEQEEGRKEGRKGLSSAWGKAWSQIVGMQKKRWGQKIY